jgi:glycine/D-amino acid oxidase-like deaminating enzyme
VALHAGPECDPDMRSLSPGYAELDGSITPFIKEHFRGVNPKAAIAEACMYTMTPDHDFIIDFLPGSKSVIIGAPCSGHGFKLGSLVGKMLADMALTGTCEDVDINTFKLDRSYEAHVLY